MLIFKQYIIGTFDYRINDITDTGKRCVRRPTVYIILFISHIKCIIIMIGTAKQYFINNTDFQGRNTVYLAIYIDSISFF